MAARARAAGQCAHAGHSRRACSGQPVRGQRSKTTPPLAGECWLEGQPVHGFAAASTPAAPRRHGCEARVAGHGGPPAGGIPERRPHRADRLNHIKAAALGPGEVDQDWVRLGLAHRLQVRALHKVLLRRGKGRGGRGGAEALWAGVAAAEGRRRRAGRRGRARGAASMRGGEHAAERCPGTTTVAETEEGTRA